MDLLNLVKKLKHSPVRNYIVPGLTSWMIKDHSDQGCIRLFTCERQQVEFITPHSHRYDLNCHVLNGEVENTIWTRSFANGDMYQETVLTYDAGRYEKTTSEIGCYATRKEISKKGETYFLESHRIHSIVFKKDTAVLVEEGPTLSNKSVILEPVVDGVVIPTFEVKEWMFKKEA